MTIDELLRIKGSREVLKININADISEAAVILTKNKIGALLVEDNDGGIIGIISERDIVGGMGQHGADLHDVSVSELMTTDLIRCSPTDSVLKAMAMMTELRVRHLPVFETDNLVGFISVGDLVKCRISEIQAEAEALRQYIAS